VHYRSQLDETMVFRDKVVPGLVVHAEIVSWNPEGAVVSFGRKVKGYIFNSHFGNKNRIEKPRKKYPVGSKVKAVVHVVEHSGNKLHLSANKMLVKNPKAFVSYEDIPVGHVGYGLIIKVSIKGIAVSLLGGLTGFVPSRMTDHDCTVLDSVYSPGDSIKVSFEHCFIVCRNGLLICIN